MLKRIWPRPDGGVMVSSFSTRPHAETDDVRFALAVFAYYPDVSPPFLVIKDDSELIYHLAGKGSDQDHIACADPGCHDRYFRDAVVWDETAPGKCACDMVKARQIHLARMRLVLGFEATRDATFLKAVETSRTPETLKATRPVEPR